MEWDRGRVGFGDPGGVGFVCQEVGDRLFRGHGQREQKRGEDERSLQVQGGEGEKEKEGNNVQDNTAYKHTTRPINQSRHRQ